MKAVILVLAVLAIAASAKINGTQAYAAFAKKTNMTFHQQMELVNCTLEVSRLFTESSKHAQGKLTHFLMESDAQHKHDIEELHKFFAHGLNLPHCSKFVISMIPTLSGKLSAAEAHQSLARRVEQNIKIHQAVLISEITKAVDQAHAGHSVQFGETIATIFEIAFGKVKPATLIDFVMKYKKPVEVSVIETDAFIQKTLNAFIKHVGLKGEVSLEKVKHLRESAQHLIHTLSSAKLRVHHAKSEVEREVIVSGVVRDAVIAAGVVAESVHNIVAPYTHLYKINRYNAVALYFRIIHNELLNLPKLQQDMYRVIVGIQGHHPVQTGEAYADFVKTLLK